jgi:hypothetical protein
MRDERLEVSVTFDPAKGYVATATRCFEIIEACHISTITLATVRNWGVPHRHRAGALLLATSADRFGIRRVQRLCASLCPR